MRTTLAILFVTVAVYLCGNPQVLWLWPATSPNYHWWQLLTYLLVHGGPLHLALNMLALLSFGPSLERSWGRMRFLGGYALCGAVAGVVQSDLAHAPTVGASAALFGLLAAWTLANPRRKILSVIPLPLPAWLVLLLYLAMTLVAAALGWLPGVAHAAHFTGASVGFMYAIYLRAGGSR
jgi:membrane associated rhomboid family serine protease